MLRIGGIGSQIGQSRPILVSFSSENPRFGIFPSSVDSPGGGNLFFFSQILTFSGFWIQKMVKKKSRYDPRDPSRSIRTGFLVNFPVGDASRSFMATHLVTKRCNLGTLGVPGLASTPLACPGQALSRPGLVQARPCPGQALSRPGLVQARPCPGLRAGGAGGRAGRIRGKSGLAGSSIHP